jgi:hypothetical protein
MVRNDIEGTTGYGISTFEGDGGNDIIVNGSAQTVTPHNGPTMGFQQFLDIKRD